MACPSGDSEEHRQDKHTAVHAASATYVKFRNAFKYLIGSLHDFDINAVRIERSCKRGTGDQERQRREECTGESAAGAANIPETDTNSFVSLIRNVCVPLAAVQSLSGVFAASDIGVVGSGVAGA